MDGELDATVEAPPSILPQKKYCDITGLEVGFSVLPPISGVGRRLGLRQGRHSVPYIRQAYPLIIIVLNRALPSLAPS